MTQDRPRITILGLNYLPEPTGNAPYTTSLARALAQRGREITVITAHPHYPEWRVQKGHGGWSRTSEDQGVRVVRLAHYVPTDPRGAKRLLSELSFGLRLLLTNWHSPDTLLMVSPALFATGIAMIRARILHRTSRRVVWVQDLYGLGLRETGAGGRLTQRVAHAVERWTFRSADTVVVIHDRFRDHVITKLGLPASSVTVIPNWSHLVDSESDRDETRRAMGWGADETVVLHSGNMGVKQGLENVVETARLADGVHAKIRFVLMGDGARRAALMELSHGVGSLQFVSPLPDAEFQAALNAADVLLVNELPGVSAMAVPSKLTSYFSTGSPVLGATDPEGITAQVLRVSGAGETVASGDPQALLAAVIDLVDDPERASRLGAAGRAHWERHLRSASAISAFEKALWPPGADV